MAGIRLGEQDMEALTEHLGSLLPVPLANLVSHLGNLEIVECVEALSRGGLRAWYEQREERLEKEDPSVLKVYLFDDYGESHDIERKNSPVGSPKE